MKQTKNNNYSTIRILTASASCSPHSSKSIDYNKVFVQKFLCLKMVFGKLLAIIRRSNELPRIQISITKNLEPSMPSILATQLSKNVSLNASLLSHKKQTDSYLFSSSQASIHDLHSIHALVRNAFIQLSSIQPLVLQYEEPLFSDTIKDLDRTLLTKEQNDVLDSNLAAFLRLCGPWVLEGMVGKVLEWLVRRFR